jgi:rhodanese-related sulfurtransferase
MRKKIKRVVLMSSLLLLSTNLFGFEVIGIEKAKYYYNTNSAIFIDARDYRKYSKGTVSKALNIPLKRYKRFKKFLPIDKSATIVIFCGGINCSLSKKLSKKLEGFGYSNIKQFAEGFPKWKALKLPTMARPIKCRDLKPKRVVIDGVELFLNEDDTVNIEWLNGKIESGGVGASTLLVDVRDAKQFKLSHVKGAINIPFRDGAIDSGRLRGRKVVIFYCNSGIVSASAKESIEDEDLKKRVFTFDDSLECDEKGQCLFK